MKYYSQDGQDKFLHQQIFGNLIGGIFVDVGAHDGKTINNTLFFEENFQWNGINIEPIPKVFDKLCKNRPNCININCAIFSREGNENFILNEGYTEMISGLEETYDCRHKERLKNELAARGGESKVISVHTRTLESVFDQYNIIKINYLTIDTEGSEFEIVKSINFEKVDIDVIGFEDNYTDRSQQIIEYLFTKGYILLPHESMDKFMMKIHK